MFASPGPGFEQKPAPGRSGPASSDWFNPSSHRLHLPCLRQQHTAFQRSNFAMPSQRPRPISWQRNWRIKRSWLGGRNFIWWFWSCCPVNWRKGNATPSGYLGQHHCRRRRPGKRSWRKGHTKLASKRGASDVKNVHPSLNRSLPSDTQITRRKVV